MLSHRKMPQGCETADGLIVKAMRIVSPCPQWSSFEGGMVYFSDEQIHCLLPHEAELSVINGDRATKHWQFLFRIIAAGQ